MASNNKQRWPHAVKLYLGVLGKIAAGKSAALEGIRDALKADRPTDRVKMFTEIVPTKVFNNYQKDPHTFAEPFQTTMAAFAATRDYWAHDFLKDFPTGTAISERPLLENRIFFTNNLSLGYIQEKYRQNYDDAIADFLPYSPNLLVYLHVSDRHSIYRMLVRAGVNPDRIAEKDYTDAYLKLLGHKYFAWVLDHIAHKRGPPILVVDWNDHVDPIANPAEYRLLIEGLLDKIEAFLVAGCLTPEIKLKSVTKPDDPLASSTGELNTCFVKRMQDFEKIPISMEKLHDYVLETIASGEAFTLYR
jgi:deoxyadenosine/deoxycytidine kinase